MGKYDGLNDKELISLLQSNDGTAVPAHLYTSTMEIEPGDAAIYMMPK